MIGMRRGDRAEHQVVQRRGCRLSSVQISSLSLHTLVFSTLGLNVKWGVCILCGCHASVCVCMSVCLHGCCVGQASRHPGRSPYRARLLQLSRQKDECFPHSSPLHICPHRPHRPPFPDVVFSKAREAVDPLGALYWGSGLWEGKRSLLWVEPKPPNYCQSLLAL